MGGEAGVGNIPENWMCPAFAESGGENGQSRFCGGSNDGTEVKSARTGAKERVTARMAVKKQGGGILCEGVKQGGAVCAEGSEIERSD